MTNDTGKLTHNQTVTLLTMLREEKSVLAGKIARNLEFGHSDFVDFYQTRLREVEDMYEIFSNARIIAMLDDTNDGI